MDKVCEAEQEMLQDKEFVAYSKKLLRELKRIEAAMDEDLETAKTLLSQLIEDTRTDIED